MKTASFLGLGQHGFHRIAYVEWGGGGGRTLVCAHGLTRNGRDFDRIAAALDPGWRVVCPDLPGRGRSDWLPQAADYTYAQYLADMTALIARLGVAELDWLGTSMGGLIGLMLAAQPGAPIRRLVLNDIGPFVPKAALERIAGYVGEDPRFSSLGEIEAYLRRVHAPFGPLGDLDWRHLALQGYRRREDGGFGLAYDPAIGDVLRRAPIEDIDLWAAWGAVRCPVLVLRGGDSDLLLPDTAARLRGDGATVVEFPGVGHAPALMAADQIAVVREWLTAP